MHYAAMLYIVNKHYFDHYMYLIWLCATHPISSNQALYYQKNISDIYKSIRTTAFILISDFVILISIWSVIV